MRFQEIHADVPIFAYLHLETTHESQEALQLLAAWLSSHNELVEAYACDGCCQLGLSFIFDVSGCVASDKGITVVIKACIPCTYIYTPTMNLL